MDLPTDMNQTTEHLTVNYFAVDGQKMAYTDVGQGSVLLFGHSYLWDSTMWQPQIAHLSQHYRCIVPDFWGHGLSDAAPFNTNTLADYAQHIVALLDSLGIDQLSMIGLSVGGMWGSELTALIPQRVQSLVLMDSFVGLEPEVALLKYQKMFAQIKKEKAIPKAMMEVIVPLFFSQAAIAENAPFVRQFKQYLTDVTGDKVLELVRIGQMVFGRRDLIETVENFALPTLIAAGTEDKPRPFFESYLMSDCITGSQLVEIPNAGHISNLEQPEFVNQMLTQFLAKVYQA